MTRKNVFNSFKSKIVQKNIRGRKMCLSFSVSEPMMNQRYKRLVPRHFLFLDCHSVSSLYLFLFVLSMSLSSSYLSLCPLCTSLSGSLYLSLSLSSLHLSLSVSSLYISLCLFPPRLSLYCLYISRSLSLSSLYLFVCLSASL